MSVSLGRAKKKTEHVYLNIRPSTKSSMEKKDSGTQENGQNAFAEW